MSIQELAEKIFAGQPFSQFLGAKLTAIGADSAEITLELVDRLKQQHGFAHGGVVSYLADNSIAFAGGIALGGDILVSEYKINYLRPARGSKLIARAQSAGGGKRQAVCVAKIYAVQDDKESLCALAQGTVVLIPSS